MGRLLSGVLAMLLLLSACGGQGQAEAAELAERVRAEYTALSGWQGTMELTADYGDSVYEFTVDVLWRREGETQLTVRVPEIISGLTARLAPEGRYLEYDGASLGIGALTEEGLSPMELVPRMMEELLEGYLAACRMLQEGEQRLLQLVYQDPDRAAGEGTVCTLYVEPDSGHLLRVELAEAGVVVLTGNMTSFTKEAMDNDNGAGQSLG
jgi:hypothetical protein